MGGKYESVCMRSRLQEAESREHKVDWHSRLVRIEVLRNLGTSVFSAMKWWPGGIAFSRPVFKINQLL